MAGAGIALRRRFHRPALRFRVLPVVGTDTCAAYAACAASPESGETPAHATIHFGGNG